MDKRERIIIYTRASDQKQTASCEDQDRIVRMWIEAKFGRYAEAYTIKGTVKDHDISGYIRPFEKRNGGAEIYAMAMRREFDTLIVYEISRLARHTEDGLRLVRELREAGVRVICIAEAVDTSDPNQSQAALGRMFSRSEEEREILRRRVLSRVELIRFQLENTGQYTTKSGKVIRKMGNEENLQRSSKRATHGRWLDRRMWLLDIQPRLVSACRAVLHENGTFKAPRSRIAARLNFEGLKYLPHGAAVSSGGWSDNIVTSAIKELKRMGAWSDELETRRGLMSLTEEQALGKHDVEKIRRRVLDGFAEA